MQIVIKRHEYKHEGIQHGILTNCPRGQLLVELPIGGQNFGRFRHFDTVEARDLALALLKAAEETDREFREYLVAIARGEPEFPPQGENGAADPDVVPFNPGGTR